MRSSLALVVIAALAAALVLHSGPHHASVGPGVADAAAVAAMEIAPQTRGALKADRHGDRHRSDKVPSAAALDDAWDYARARGGAVSFAVVNSEGKLRGRDADRRYAAASTVKVMLLAAELRRLKKAGEGIDSQTDSLLRSMITASDNDAADAIYARVGDAGMYDVAKRAGMSQFTVAGYWGNAQVSANDLAKLFANLDRVLVRRFREYGKGLLGAIIPSERWGIADAVGDRWAIRFKGGWLPDHALVHQAAELRERDGNRELSIAVMTDDQPSFEYAVETVRGIAQRLLGR
jgi:Beta-lactamase enzyme family